FLPTIRFPITPRSTSGLRCMNTGSRPRENAGKRVNGGSGSCEGHTCRRLRCSAHNAHAEHRRHDLSLLFSSEEPVRLARYIPAFALFVVFSVPALAQQFNPNLYQEMRWRMIGPFRGGRTVAISGIPAQPNVFFMAPNNGGVWKTIDYGHTWSPIFDDQ